MSSITHNAADKHEHWDLVITPKNSLFNLNLKEVWSYRDLMWLFVKRDFVAQYKQTILGPLWHFIQPLFTTLMFFIVFGTIAKIKTDTGMHPILFYMSGVTIWNYFSACLSNTSNTFVANAGIFGKVYFPRLVIPLSVVISNIVKFGIQFLLLLLVMVFFSFKGFPIKFGWAWLLIPVLITMMSGLGLGLGIIISSLTTKYRDFSVFIGFAVQLLMYITPVVLPMSYYNQSKYKFLVTFNPLSSIVEAFRYALFQTGTLNTGGLLYSLAFIVVVIFIGLIVFAKVERSFMDTV
ncbi:ABC transporter permease [Ferruginibacter lapsinanis]|uniref:ABC transporter permease n=1 Tax=Ferruginibacter lapsinanis TaxID=563172 RepID=UPI001E608EA1|nr:ABC transporter permease [Ferruginibacter lapsinanis]UEG49475.1 ABC transporter permease [Ferruginibacter lapsinanis]